MTIVSKKELSEILGVTDRTITNWEQEGLPIHAKGGKGKPTTYETKDVVDWRISTQINAFLEGNEEASKSLGVLKIKAQLKKLDASGDREVLRLKKEQSQLIHKEEVEAAWAEIVLKFRSAVLSYASRVAPDIINISDVPTAINVLDKNMCFVLETLSKLPEYENTVELPDVDIDEVTDVKE